MPFGLNILAGLILLVLAARNDHLSPVLAGGRFTSGQVALLLFSFGQGSDACSVALTSCPDGHKASMVVRLILLAYADADVDILALIDAIYA